MKRKREKILVLDLDETLVHSTVMKIPEYTYKVTKSDTGLTFYVRERPGLKKFMTVVAKWFTVIIMTASLQSYADPIIDRISKFGKVDGRYYRQSCTNVNGYYIKDLDSIARDCDVGLEDVIIVDNSPVSYAKQPDNAIPIKSWYGEKKDVELLNLLTLLDALKFVGDVRSILMHKDK